MNTDLDIAKLKEAAKDAAAGPWSTNGRELFDDIGSTLVVALGITANRKPEPLLHYIAEADPTTILALIEVVESNPEPNPCACEWDGDEVVSACSAHEAWLETQRAPHGLRAMKGWSL